MSLRYYELACFRYRFELGIQGRRLHPASLRGQAEALSSRRAVCWECGRRGSGCLGAAEVQTAATSPACFSPLAGRIARRNPTRFVLWELGVLPEAGS